MWWVGKFIWVSIFAEWNWALLWLIGVAWTDQSENQISLIDLSLPTGWRSDKTEDFKVPCGTCAVCKQDIMKCRCSLMSSIHMLYVEMKTSLYNIFLNFLFSLAKAIKCTYNTLFCNLILIYIFFSHKYPYLPRNISIIKWPAGKSPRNLPEKKNELTKQYSARTKFWLMITW